MNLNKVIGFFREGLLWTIDVSQLGRLQRWGLHLLRRLVMAVELFVSRNLSSHASALTYASILGAVPILAIIFAIARGFGFERLIEEKLTTSVRFTPEMTSALMDFVNSYLERARGGVFIGVGMVMLFYTLINLTSDIETAFNTIWKVKTSRNIYRRAVDYISVFFLLPIIIVITSGLQIFLAGIGHFLPSFTFLNHGIELLVQSTPFVLAGLGFALLYKMMPNTEVHWRAALVPGLLAGSVFQLLQWFYIHSQMWISGYNAIYGSFAAVPLFMLWLQLSWTICLFGAQLSYANQMEADFAFEKRAPHLNRQAHDRVAVQVLSELQTAFQHSQTLTAQDIANHTHVPLSLVNSILDEMTSDPRRPLAREVVHGRGTTSHFLLAGQMVENLEDTVATYFRQLGDDLDEVG